MISAIQPEPRNFKFAKIRGWEWGGTEWVERRGGGRDGELGETAVVERLGWWGRRGAGGDGVGAGEVGCNGGGDDRFLINRWPAKSINSLMK